MNKIERLIVTVSGVAYDVTVERVDGTAPVTTAAPVAAPAPKAAPAPAVAPAAPAAAPSGAKISVSAPMPGTILSVNVKVGDKVEKGAVLCILEAMKMENEIMAPEAGTVVAVNATKGSTVTAGDLLVALA